MACKERKCGVTSASRDENGQVDVWHLAKRQISNKGAEREIRPRYR